MFSGNNLYPFFQHYSMLWLEYGYSPSVHGQFLFYFSLCFPLQRDSSREVCRNWSRDGNCSYGETCHFLHENYSGRSSKRYIRLDAHIYNSYDLPLPRYKIKIYLMLIRIEHFILAISCRDLRWREAVSVCSPRAQVQLGILGKRGIKN